MKRLTAMAAMIICCAGAAVAQTEGKSCCAEKAQAVVRTVAATEAKDCCAEKAAAQTVAAADKQCRAEKAEAQAVALQASQTVDPAGACCSSKTEGAAQQVALAAEGDCCKTACSEAQQAAGGCSSEGKLAVLAADLPAIKRKVGAEVTNCPVKAGELSQASGQPVVYLVGQKSFEDEGSASRAYAAELTSYLDRATRVQFAVDGQCTPCPEAASKACSEGKTMKYRVAGRDFDNAEAAIRAAAMAYGASRQVTLNYAVNGRCAGSCEQTAKAQSIATAQPVVYRVGDKETKCDVQASVMLAIARIEAAVTAAQAVPQS
jgi:hypothetical protein